jgi:hypothetical protein
MNGTPDGLIEVKGYIPWVGKVKRKSWWKIRIVVREYQWAVGFFEL